MSLTSPIPPDIDRRFGGLRRLYGDDALERLQAGHVAVAGLGGVGSWAAEALARSGVGALTLIDLDHIAESNINRQVHALDSTLGQAKVEALAERIRAIHPGCRLTCVDDFVEPDNLLTVLPGPYQAVLDCTDQASAKLAMILDARQRGHLLVTCGAAGGKTDPLALRSGDLAHATQDPLLARLRHTLRRQHGYPRQDGKRTPRMGVTAIWVEQPMRRPVQDCALPDGSAPQGLSCAGYGSLVTVTAAMGLAAAQAALDAVLSVRRA